MEEVTDAKMVEELKVAVELKIAPLLNVCKAVQTTELAAVTKPGLLKDNEFPLNESPPPKVVVCNCPFTSAERSVFVAIAKTVDELKVAVELNAAPALKAWSADQITELALVTKPGFVKPRVTEPVPFVTVTPPPAVRFVTPVFWTERTLPEVAIWMPVEAFRATVPVRLPREPTPVTLPVAPLKEPTPATVPVAPLKERTPILERTLPARFSPVEMEVVPSWPEEFKKAMVEVAKENMVELLNVAVEFAASPPPNV